MPELTLPTPYATVVDLQRYWRTLSSGEQTRATDLLGWAAHLIQKQHGWAQFDALDCAQVSMDMVKRAMINGDGVSESTASQAMADMSAARTDRYVNPMGNLYITVYEQDRLAGRTGKRGGSLTLSSNVRVPAEPWNNQPSAQTDAPGS